ncbi:MAG: dihydrofolate reductase, partial [Planctomycetes bacterium]|nr:dihydrofolate reductase [Planctomycetota bacterium]
METRLVYYVAQTVDGFIADRTGGVGFLDGLDESGGDYGYGEFYAGIDSLVMGRATYDFVRSMGVWHYAGKPTVVMTSRPGDDAPEDVRFSDRGPREVLEEVRAAGGGSTWLVGGGRLAGAFCAADLIDEWVVTVIPCVLGSGVPLASGMPATTKLELIDQASFRGGLVQLRYRI